MGEEIVYDGYVEVHDNGSYLAHILDLPGCSAVGATESAALTQVLARIPSYYAWLRQHDDYTPEVQGPFQVVAKEVVRIGEPGQRGGAFFTTDADVVTNEDLDWYLALLDWAYTDLFASAQSAWNAPIGPDGRSPEATIEQVAQGQLWLISRLEERPNVPRVDQLPGTALDHLRQVWQASLARLRSASDVERERTLEHEGERWSLRKVLRRSILSVMQALDVVNRHP